VDKVQEEGLAGTILTNDEPDAGAAVGDVLYIAQQCLDLVHAAYLDVLVANTWHHAST
jgi:hypothetical protein